MFALRTSTFRSVLVRQVGSRFKHTATSNRRTSPRDAPTSTDYTMAIMAAANTGHFGDGLLNAARMKDARVSPNISVYNALMSLAAREGSWLFSWAILDDMVHLGIQPTPTTFGHLIRAQRQRPHTNLWCAIQRMNQLGIKPNPAIYTAIIECLVEQGNVEMALHYIFIMKNQKMIPELSAVQAVVTLAADCGYSRLAIELATYFEKASLRRLEESTWIACLASAAQNYYVDGVVTAWSTVTEELNIPPNEGVCLSVLNTAARHGLPDLATDVLRVLKLTGVAWKEYHFAALIEAFVRNGQLKEALVTLHIMRTNDIDLLDTTSSYILNDITRDVESLDAAWAVIDEIHSSGSGLGIDALKVVIEASILLGDLQRAVGIYKSFADYDLKPDAATFNLMLDGCISAQHRQLGDILLADMKEARVQPDIVTYEKMIRLCLTQEVYEDAFYYLEEMKAASFVPPKSIYDALLEKCSTVNDARGGMVMQEMKECGYKSSPQSRSQEGSVRNTPRHR